VFGVAKAGKPDVMDILAETIAEFDIVAIQEIRDSSGRAIIDLEKTVEALGADYDVVVGPRLGRTTSKEQYAYIYRTATVDYNESYTYDDSLLDLFHREPLVASFSTVTGTFDFVLAVIHTDPDEATKEIGSLPLVIQDAKTHYPGELDIIVLGDFNADCSYFDEDDMTCPLRDDSFTWLITNDMDTNVASTSCTYDRVVITVDTLSEAQVDAGVYRFDQIFGLTGEETKDVSDHYPVWVEISYPDGSSSTDGSSSGGGCFIETFIKVQGVF
jgi:endonuclease/exonuclease/phosphatase family metal-dependent hydrolase